MNTFINLIKRSLIEKGTRDGVGASGEIKALVGASLLPTLNLETELWPASSLYSLVGLVGGLMQGLRRIQNSRAIIMEILLSKWAS